MYIFYNIFSLYLLLSKKAFILTVPTRLDKIPSRHDVMETFHLCISSRNFTIIYLDVAIFILVPSSYKCRRRDYEKRIYGVVDSERVAATPIAN